MSWLLQSQKQEWFVRSAVWNDGLATVDVERLTPLLLRAADLLRQPWYGLSPSTQTFARTRGP